MTENRSYHILNLLGKGGFGAVYRANLESAGGFSKPVALKILHDSANDVEEVAMRMRDEARMLGLIQHRAIVHVDGLIRLDGRWAIVMEFVHGVDLGRLVKNGPMPAGPALEIISEVASALHVAYETHGPDDKILRLLHRDIKPANIQITGQGEIKVLDFGIARAEFQQREAETASMLFGTEQYMAPERLDLIETHRGDVYSVGLVLYELLMGEAFGRAYASVRRHDERLVERMATLDARGVDPALSQLISDCLAYEPEDRMDARELARRARDLARNLRQISLVDWAETTIPALVEDREYESDALSGSTLIETPSGVIMTQEEVEGPDHVPSSGWTHQTRWFANDHTPEPVRPAATEPEVAEPEVAEPEVAEPEVAEPEACASDTTTTTPPVHHRAVSSSEPADRSERLNTVILWLVGGVCALTVAVGGVLIIALAALVIFPPGPADDVDAAVHVKSDVGSKVVETPVFEPAEAGAFDVDTGDVDALPLSQPAPATADLGGAMDPAPVPSAVIAAPEEVSGSEPEVIDPEPEVTGAEPEVTHPCGGQKRLEVTATLGRLDSTQLSCLDALVRDSSRRQVVREADGRLVLVNHQYRCSRRGQCEPYEQALRYFFAEITRSDPELMYGFVSVLFKKPNRTLEQNQEVILWAERALERRAAWKAAVYVSRVESLYSMRAFAAQQAWQRAAQERTVDRLSAKYRGKAKTAALDWANFLQQLGRDPSRAINLCAQAMGSVESCKRFLDEDRESRTITFVSEPLGAAIYIGDKEIGKTPMSHDLEAGVHAARMELVDASKQWEITIENGGPVRYTWDSRSNTIKKGY